MLSPGTLLQNRYFIVKPIGEGGMGAVHLAIDQRLGNTVALKVSFHTAHDRLRAAFEREARLLASLHHPALPSVTDYFSENDGQFLIMEYIPGEDLAEMLTRRGGAFPPGQVLGWADQLLDALDYLHTQESPIIHRDIKPSNLKLTARGQIVLLDFGLAKDTNMPTIVTDASKTVLGYSLNYAPLEQLQGQGTGPRSDLYSLSATLYHLMTGVQPVDVLKRLDAVASAQPDPLPRANELNSEVATEVAAVLHQAMAIGRDQRPTTAAEMRMMLREAEAASRQAAPRSPSPIIHTTQSPEPFIPSSPSQPDPHLTPVFTETGSDEAVPEPLAAMNRPAAYVLPSSQSRSSVEVKDHKPQITKDSKTVPSTPTHQSAAPISVAEKELSRSLWLRPMMGAAAAVVLVIVVAAIWWLLHSRSTTTNQQKLVATSTPLVAQSPTPAPTPRLPVALSGRLLSTLPTQREKNKVTISSDGEMVATLGDNNEVLLWRVSDGSLLKTLKGHTQPGRSVAISPNGQFVASGSDNGEIRLWQTSDGNLMTILVGHTQYVFIVGFSPNGQNLVSASGDKTVRVRRVDDPKTILYNLSFKPEDKIITISPDQQMIALYGSDKGVRLVSISNNNLIVTLERHSYDVSCGSFSADGQFLALGSRDGAVRLWRVSDGSLIRTQQGPEGEVGSVAFSQDGLMIAAGWSDGTIGLWRVNDVSLMSRPLEGHEKIVKSLFFSADGRVLASASDDKTVRLWQVMEGEQ